MSELHVLFRVGGAEYALPARDVVQMETFSGATHVPGVRPWVIGLVQIRGRVVPVMDLRLRLGLPPADAVLERRVVVGEAGGRSVALLVDSARQVVELPPEAVSPPPEALGSGRGVVKGVAKVGERLVLLLDFQALIREEAHDEEAHP